MCLKVIQILTVLIGLIPKLSSSDQLPTCHPKDFKYAFTDCDEFNGRWRVSVPVNPKKCTGGAPNAPIRAEGCSFACDAGKFFNSTSLLCQDCEPGFYSLGGGVRFEAFKKENFAALGFHVNTQVPTPRSNCNGWQVNANYLEAISNFSDGGCLSTITYTVKIVKTGKLKFTYQYIIPDDLASAVLFTFIYRNYEDDDDRFTYSRETAYNTKYPGVTNENQKWKTIEINLRKPGLYVFVWKSVTIGHSGYFHSESFRPSSQTDSKRSGNFGRIRIKSIEVIGVEYASECTPCQPGSYNNQRGGVFCDVCQPDTATDKTGATTCMPCDLAKYAPRGSEKCFDKPICSKNDYYEVVSECENKKQHYFYKWIEPKICRDINNVLPQPFETSCNMTSDKKKNQLCNAGMELHEGVCKNCPEDYFNDGTFEKCKNCPPSTAPVYALFYNIWYDEKSKNEQDLPGNFTTQCFSSDEENSCESGKEPVPLAWRSTSDNKHYIRTSPLYLDSYLILSLPISGFRSRIGGEITFNFELKCMVNDKCEFMFLESKMKNSVQPQANIIRQWETSQGIETFKYRVRENSTIKFSWIFKRTNDFQSHVKIYEIRVTDTIEGGAVQCKPCPLGSGENCVPCPYGQYLEVNNFTSNVNSNTSNDGTKIIEEKSSCKRCPPDYSINSSLAFPIGRQNSCIKCGPGLVANDQGTGCFSNCNLTLERNTYDLKQMKQPLLLKGGFLFTAGGTQYFHLFNITFCGNSKATCVNNITTYDNSDDGEDFAVSSMICRSTIVPDGDQIFTTQSVSLGDELIGISRATSYKNISVHREFRTTNSDIHFYFKTRTGTNACPKGRHLTLTIRCSPELENNDTISTPKSCPDGTCDGCNFHLLVRTKTAAACRVCQPSDYETVVGECVEGTQHIHFVNPRGCIISPTGPISVEKRTCSVIPKQVQIAIAFVSAFGMMLLFMVFHFWKKNRRLEYKYSKLIENEKPAECCAEDDEDDDDETEVIIQGKKHKVSGESGYESIRLTKHDCDEEI